MYVVNPDTDSIFNDTTCGVPNPLVPHEHPYPTRYHGPWFGAHSQRSRWRENPYMVPVDAGPGLRGFGEDAPPSLGVRVFRGIFAGVIGASAGYVAALVSKERDKSKIVLSCAAAAIVADGLMSSMRFYDVQMQKGEIG